MNLELSEKQAVNLAVLLSVIPTYTSNLPEPYEKMRIEWLEKMADIFPNLKP